MKKLICLLVFLGCSLFAEAHVADSLSYRYQGIRKNSKPIYTAEGDTIVSSFEINYPVFKQAEWNAIAKNLIYQSQYDKAQYKSLDDYLKAFIQTSEEENKLTDFPRNWGREIYLMVSQQLKGTRTLSFTLSDEGYTGGAHGYALLSFYNYDKLSKRKLKLTDIIDQKNINKLHAVGEKIFRKEENLSPTQALDHYFFKDNKFKLNSNFLIQKKGLLFFFNQYEIRSYAEGPMELFIPYTAIKNLIKPNPYTPKLIP